MNLFFNPVNAFAFALLLGMLIFIHESGHFFVAKFLGIQVEVFSLGFGPRLFGWRRNGTDYRISLLPLGGYVKMLGEQPGEELHGDPGEFLSRSKWEKFFVLVMGALLNIVLAVALMSGVYMHGVPTARYQEDPAVIGKVEPGSPAAKAGLQPLDEILSIGETPVPSWSALQIAVALNPDQTLPFHIRRDGREQTVEVRIGETRREAMGKIGVAPKIDAMVVAGVSKEGPAAAAGLQDGDLLLKVNGQDLGTDLEAVSDLLYQGAGKSVDLDLSRDGKPYTATITPKAVEKGDGSDPGFGLSYETVFKKYGPLGAIVQSCKWNLRYTGLLFETIKGLVAGQLSLRTLSGPIEIYRYTGQAWQGGGIAYFSFMALVSLQLGIVNLLPIPVLDGGHVFILAIEGVLRRDLSMVVKERMMQVGLVLLLLLMGTVISLDIYKATLN
ncbi:MAG TPA: RIP metalloprotease RseP [Candidatus Saccharimonadales bacterium]|nr:RIP metalloprotease RseP [Candidatus Saccharimonadales bacterium]